MLNIGRFPIVFLGDPRRHRAGAAQHAAESEQYAYVLRLPRRVLFISEALLPVVKDMVGADAGYRTRHASRVTTAHGQKNCPRMRQRE